MRRFLLLAATLAVVLAAPATADAALSYFSGPVMHSARTVLVDWTNGVSSTYTGGDPGFLQALAAQTGSPASLTGVLAQYGDTTSHNYAGGSYEGQHVITPSPSRCADPTTACTVQHDSDIASELVSQVNAGNLPPPVSSDGRDTLYVVLFPPKTTVCDQPGSCSGKTFCAYHSGTTLPGGKDLLYAVLPDFAGSNSCGATPGFNNQTSVISHEWAEAINDPEVGSAQSIGPPLAWYDSGMSGGEIADLCNAIHATNGGYTVQKLWSNKLNGCVGSEAGSGGYAAPSASFAAPAAPTASSAATFDGTASSDPAGNSGGASYNGTSYPIPSGIASYDWDWGDGSVHGSGATASHTFTALGTYNVTLTVTDNLGFTSATTQSVSVDPAGAADTTPASAVTTTGATLNGLVKPHASAGSYHFEYALSPGGAASSTPETPLPASGAHQTVSADVGGLTPNRSYGFKLVVTLSGSTTVGRQLSFATALPPAPGAVAQPASDVGISGATLHAAIDPRSAPTSYRFEYGPSTTYGASTPAADMGAGAGTVSYALAGLAPGTTYHYRVLATNDGGTSVSGDQAFTTQTPLIVSPLPGTPGPAPVVPKLLSLSPLSRQRLATVLKHGLRVAFGCDRACSITFTLVARQRATGRGVAMPVTLARGAARLRRRGKGHAVLRLTKAGRKALARARSTKLLLTAVPDAGAGAPATPRQLELTLRR